MKRYLPFVIITIVLVLAIGAGALMLRRSERTPAVPVDDISSNVTKAKDSPHVRGDENAPVTLEEFGDFQCPSCRLLYLEMKNIKAEYGPSRLRIVFRQFPLATMHEHALEAAHAAEAAGLQNRFWEMHDLLYDNQQTWSTASEVRPVFLSYARQLGLDTERFARDMDSTEVSKRVLNDEARGESLHVVGTPTVFINGREIPPQEMTKEGLRSAIDRALHEKGQ
jgi:protein-disulfide isomerase